MDSTDLRILEILVQNCRISYATIAKALRISKDTVAFRIKRLKEQGHYLQDILFIDARRLGYTRFQILIQFESGVTNKEEIYETLSRYPRALWINTFIGLYDVQVIVDANNAFELNEIRKKVFDICENKIKAHATLTNLYEFEFSQLNPDLDLKTPFEKKNDHSFSKMLCTRNFPLKKDFGIYAPSKLDIEILRVLADNPAEPLLSIANKLDVDRKTVKKRIERLIENEVISSFGAIPNLSKMGYVTYTLLIRLVQDTPDTVVKKPLQELNNIFYAARFYGDYDVILYLNARTPAELNATIEKFKLTIGNYIAHSDLAIMDKVLCWRQYSKGLYEDLKSHFSTSL